MRKMQDAKTKGAMSMLILLLFLSLAIMFFLSSETLKNMLKLLVIALIMLAGLAVASTPHHVKMGVEKNGTL